MSEVETHYGIRYTSQSYEGSHITEYGPDRERAIAEYRPSCDSFSTELLKRRVTYGAWRPASTKAMPKTDQVSPDQPAQFDLVDTEEM